MPLPIAPIVAGAARAVATQAGRQALAQGAKQVHQYLISELDADEAKEYYYVTPFKSAEKALKAAFDQVGKDATVYVMPHGPDILPTTA